MIRSLFKRSGIYFGGLVAGKVLSFLVFILFARALLPTNFGNFVLFVTLLQLITYFADFGLVQWYQKKAATDDRDELLDKVISARIVTLFISYLLSLIFLLLSSSFNLQTSLVFLLALAPEAFLSIFDGYYLKRGESFTVSLKTLLRMIFLFFVFLFFTSSFSFEIAISSYTVSSFLVLVWYGPWKKMANVRIDLGIRKVGIVLRSSSSYAFLIFSSFLYARGDSLVIKYVLNSASLGVYGAAYRYLESLSLVPTALAHNLFPLSAKPNTITVTHLLKLVFVLSVLGLTTSSALYLFSDTLIVALLGVEYVSAIPVLKIFSVVLFLFFINSPLATIVQSSNLIRKFLPFGFANTVVNLILNLGLIPIYGIGAAALVMLFTELTGFFINLYFVKKIYSR